MDNYKMMIIENQAKKTVENLEKNNMKAFFVKDCEQARMKVKELIKEGETVACGGSMTLKEAGIIELLENSKYNYLNFAKATNSENLEDMRRQALTSDTFLSSSNAITEDGILYNVDGHSNRIAGIVYGPKSVIIVAGYNKIVKNLKDAEQRVKSIAAPANCKRLSCDTYCNKAGECMSIKNGKGYMTDGCNSDARICANYLVCAKQRTKDRIKVIIVGEELGY